MTEEQKQAVLDNIGLVYSTIKQLNIKITDDNIQTGCIGLINGIKTFDASKGYKISSYLTTCIKNEVVKEYLLSKCDNRKANNKAISIYEEESEGLMIIDTLYSPTNVEREVLFKIEMERVYDSINKLKPIYKEIIEYRHGLNDGKPLNLPEIAKIYGVSHQNINQKLNTIYKKLRDELNEKDNRKDKNKNTK